MIGQFLPTSTPPRRRRCIRRPPGAPAALDDGWADRGALRRGRQAACCWTPPASRWPGLGARPDEVSFTANGNPGPARRHAWQPGRRRGGQFVTPRRTLSRADAVETYPGPVAVDRGGRPGPGRRRRVRGRRPGCRRGGRAGGQPRGGYDPAGHRDCGGAARRAPGGRRHPVRWGMPTWPLGWSVLAVTPAPGGGRPGSACWRSAPHALALALSGPMTGRRTHPGRAGRAGHRRGGGLSARGPAEQAETAARHARLIDRIRATVAATVPTSRCWAIRSGGCRIW